MLLLVGQLLVGSGPGVNSQSLGVANARRKTLECTIKHALVYHLLGKIGNQLEAIDNLASSRRTTLNTNRQNTTKSASQILLRRSVRRVILKTGIRDPRDMLILLEPLSQGKRISSMALAAQTQRLQTKDQLLGRERVQSGAQVTQNLDTHADGKGDGTKGLPELESVVAL